MEKTMQVSSSKGPRKKQVGLKFYSQAGRHTRAVLISLLWNKTADNC